MFFCQLDQFANAVLDFNSRIQNRRRRDFCGLGQSSITRSLWCGRNAHDFQRSDSSGSLQSRSGSNMSFCSTALRLALNPLCRRLSAASPSFRMPGQDYAVTDLTKTFDLPRGSGSTTNCRPGRRAAKVRGAVPAGQELVFANLLRHRCSALVALSDPLRCRADAARPPVEAAATEQRPSSEAS